MKRYLKVLRHPRTIRCRRFIIREKAFHPPHSQKRQWNVWRWNCCCCCCCYTNTNLWCCTSRMRIINYKIWRDASFSWWFRWLSRSPFDYYRVLLLLLSRGGLPYHQAGVYSGIFITVGWRVWENRKTKYVCNSLIGFRTFVSFCQRYYFIWPNSLFVTLFYLERGFPPYFD